MKDSEWSNRTTSKIRNTLSPYLFTQVTWSMLIRKEKRWRFTMHSIEVSELKASWLKSQQNLAKNGFIDMQVPFSNICKTLEENKLLFIEELTMIPKEKLETYSLLNPLLPLQKTLTLPKTSPCNITVKIQTSHWHYLRWKFVQESR